MNELFGPLLDLIERHPKRLMGVLGALFLGTGVTAFGLAPDTSVDQLPVRQLVEAVQPLELPAAQNQSAAFVMYRSDLTRRDDTAQTLLQRLGVNDSAAAAFLRQDKTASELFSGRSGKLVNTETSDDRLLQRLSARWLPSEDSTSYSLLVVERQNDQWTAKLKQAPLTATTRLSSGTINSSLFAATDAARLPDSVASQLADLFSGEIDFRRELRAGDRFSVVYEALEANGEVLKFGRLLSAEFINAGKAHRVVWFQPAGQKGAYYTFDGKSLQRAFLTSPLTFSRVSSGYGMRFHPISGREKPHLGVDFAAPTGTAVRSVADGTVEFAGWQNGYGNVIRVKHRQDKTTVYAHLSRIGVRKGQRVEQSDVIGQVGSTGSSTGPHLHFEFRERDVPRDPLLATRASEGLPLSASERANFAQAARNMTNKLAAASTLIQASAE
ncbi:MAG TPA: peptidoglycan DD-metalloendopeptidase family protein [Macromonas sp.]|nr:peptidoglycan DD-metalloendopeptidase family protein [Macromonas sp.]